MKTTFEVRIMRTQPQHYNFVIKADSADEAEKIAMQQAGGVDFNEGTRSDAEYVVEHCEELAE